MNSTVTQNSESISHSELDLTQLSVSYYSLTTKLENLNIYHLLVIQQFDQRVEYLYQWKLLLNEINKTEDIECVK